MLAFADRLHAFDTRVDDLATKIDAQVNQLHSHWNGQSAEAQKARHDEWMAEAARMRESVSALRDAARRAHRNYSEAVAANLAMWP